MIPLRVLELGNFVVPAYAGMILAEQGAVTVTCEFCGRPYQFDAIDVERLFALGVSPESPQSLN